MSAEQLFGGRTAIVLGAGGIIGGAIAHDLAAHGAQVVGVDIAPSVDTPDWPGTGHRLISCDVTDDRALAAVFAQLDEPATALVNSTICQEEAPLTAQPAAAFHRAYDVMTVAGMRWATALVERLDGRQASLVTISSVHAAGAVPRFGPYAAAKAAGLALVRAMAVEWGPLGVRVNAVAPAFVPGPARNVDEPAEARARRLSRFPLGSFPSARDVATATRFLLSDDAAAITGTCLPVDAGLLSTLP